MQILSGRALASAAFLWLCASAPQLAAAQAVDFAGGYAQDFDTLAASGSTGTALPPGWAFAKNEQPSTSYGVSSGVPESGNLYSFGAAGSSERALGSIASNSTSSVRYGLALTNATGSLQNALALNFWVEQWRLGAPNRDDRIGFQYSLNASGIADSAATWVAVTGLGFTGPVREGAPGARDGNLPANRAEVSGEITGLDWAAGQTLWLRWSDANIGGVDDGLAIDDLVIGSAEDRPPALLSTMPADEAADVDPGQALRLRFSEAVDLDAAAVVFSCGGSAVAFSSNSPASEIVLTPNSALPFASSCALQIPAAAITDRDGTPDALAQAITLTFGTAADLPPQVVSTTPADGAVNVAPAVTPTVQFSETVTLTAPAFSLECDAAGAIGLSHPGSGQNITLSPQALLQEGDSCTLRILAEQIRDAANQPMAANVTLQFEVSAGAGGYYARVNTGSPEQLRCSLHATIDGHRTSPYGWVELELADEDPLDTNAILDIYRNCSYPKPGARVGGSGAAATCGSTSGLRYNREHVWPRSLGFNNNGLAAHNDLHMLHLSDEGFNGNRGNKPFAYCPQSSGCQENRTVAYNGEGGGDGSYPGNSNWYTSNDGNTGSYEVWHKVRGNMARALFYMAIRYEGQADDQTNDGDIPDLELTDDRSQIVITSNSAARAYMGLLSVLLEWHQQDPVDARERERNEIVFSYQGNRNPFVDHPEWATRALFESSQPGLCEPVLRPEVFANGFEGLN